MNTTLIATQNLSKLQTDFEKLQKKAAKLNCPIPELIIGKTVMVHAGYNEFGENFFVEKIEVSVTGDAPKLNGWTFIGTVENVEGMTVLRSIPGQEIPATYRDANPCNCDHCKINRLRNSTFIVKHDNGTFMQVGRACLKDFLGHASPEKIAAHAQYLAELTFSDYEDAEAFGGRQVLMCNVDSVVAASIRSIKMFGYQKTDSDQSTRDNVAFHCFNNDPNNRLPVQTEDKELAVQAIEWMQKQTGAEFMMNLAVYSKCQVVAQKAFGYLAAGTMMFLKTFDAIKAHNVIPDINNNEIAAVGQKIKVNATVLTATTFTRAAYHYYDNCVSQVLMMKTEDGKLIKMFTSNMDIKQDDVVIVSGTVKEHSAETFDKSKFHGCMVTQMAPRTRLTVI